MSPRDIAFCALLLPGAALPLIPIFLSRCRTRSEGLARRAWTATAWFWFFGIALGEVTGWVLMLRRTLQLGFMSLRVATPASADAALLLCWAVLAAGAAWLAYRVASDSRSAR